LSPFRATAFFGIAVLAAGCSPSTPSQQASPATRSAANIATALAGISEDRAVSLLEAALNKRKVADLDCLGFASDSDVPAGSKATLWEFAAREIHNEKCGGDPSISHVRDRYSVGSNGEVSVLDVTSGEYKAL
jgi:hypothetical protein